MMHAQLQEITAADSQDHHLRRVRSNFDAMTLVR